jgi:hypothetical protein
MTIPRSQQYISVKKYTGTDPDPALFCPPHGYLKPDGPWTPPVITPEPDSEQILLLCDDLGQGVLAMYCTASAGNVLCEIFSDTMTFISSASAVNTHRLEFPTFGTGTYYIVRFTPVNTGASLTQFYRTTYTGYITDYRIWQAQFYTPNLTTLANAFNGISVFKRCVFHTNMNALSSMASSFYNTPIETVVWPSEMNGLTTMASCFSYTYMVNIIDLSGTSFNSLQTMISFAEYSNVVELKYPASLPAITIMQNANRYCSVLKKITMPVSVPLLENISNMCGYCYLLPGVLTFPEMPSMINAVGACIGSNSLTKVVFQGAMNSCTNFSSVVRYCSSLTEFVMPTSLNGIVTAAGIQYCAYDCPGLNKVTLPLSMNQMVAGPVGGIWSGNNAYVLKEISTCNDWGANMMAISITSHKLTAFQQPNLKVLSLIIGFSNTLPAPLTTLDIDWAGSSYGGTGTQIAIRAQLSAAEIDRIFTALPAMAKTIDVRYNPGYATCNKSIAQAKGWTVV